MKQTILFRDFTRAGALPHQLGLIYLGMGEHAKAFSLCEQALISDRSDVAHSIPKYYMRVLDDEPRMRQIKHKLGISVD